jgi:cold shock CspA family protein
MPLSTRTIGPGRPVLAGEVSQFDQARGVGSVRDDQGREWFFHCTQIADGSRTIGIGQAVTFFVVPGHRGQYEAAKVTPLNPAAG